MNLNVPKNISSKKTLKDLQANKQDLFENFAGKEEKLIEIRKEDVSKEAMAYFERYSRKNMPDEEYKEGNFTKIRCIFHGLPTPYISYVALQEEKIPGYGEQGIFIYDQDSTDQDSTDQEIGYSEIRLRTVYEDKIAKERFKDKPFVGWNKTKNGEENRFKKQTKEHDYTYQGYGKKRVEMMNMIAQQVRGLKLHSGMSRAKYVTPIREKLVQEGKAKKYREYTGEERYCFI